MCLCYVHYLEHDAENHIGRRHVLLCSLKSENRTENILKYLSGSKSGLCHKDQRGLVDLWLWLQTMVDQEREGADVGVGKPHQRPNFPT